MELHCSRGHRVELHCSCGNRVELHCSGCLPGLQGHWSLTGPGKVGLHSLEKYALPEIGWIARSGMKCATTIMSHRVKGVRRPRPPMTIRLLISRSYPAVIFGGRLLLGTRTAAYNRSARPISILWRRSPILTLLLSVFLGQLLERCQEWREKRTRVSRDLGGELDSHSPSAFSAAPSSFLRQ